jgi:hypothetical protein
MTTSLLLELLARSGLGSPLSYLGCPHPVTAPREDGAAAVWYTPDEKCNVES